MSDERGARTDVMRGSGEVSLEERGVMRGGVRGERCHERKEVV